MLEGYYDNNTLSCYNESEEQPDQENYEMTPKTMIITARIGSHDVIALIDSGSIHNIISERLANGCDYQWCQLQPS